jgi:hypothetical protein
MSRSLNQGSPRRTEGIAATPAIRGNADSPEAASDSAQQLGHSTEDASFSLAVTFRSGTSTMPEGMRVNSTPRYVPGNAMILTDPVGNWQGLCEGMENLHLEDEERHKVGIYLLPPANMLKIVLGFIRSWRIQCQVRFRNLTLYHEPFK